MSISQQESTLIVLWFLKEQSVETPERGSNYGIGTKVAFDFGARTLSSNLAPIGGGERKLPETAVNSDSVFKERNSEPRL